MVYYAVCLAVLVTAYFVNTATITVIYHRGWAHRALTIAPWLERFMRVAGNWLTGLDPKGWVCMHRMHHAHSDTEKDPHSPLHKGFFGVLYAQLKAYERCLVGISRKDPTYLRVVEDLEFDISALNRRRLWQLPYLVHFGIAVVLATVLGWWLLGACYFFGIMSHPIEGWLVNSFGHAFGTRNFDTPDNSRNNHPVGLFVFGEGYQNNHHQYPSSAKFSYRWYELDTGWAVCWVLDKLGLVRVHREKLIPAPDSSPDSVPHRSPQRATRRTRAARALPPTINPLAGR